MPYGFLLKSCNKQCMYIYCREDPAVTIIFPRSCQGWTQTRFGFFLSRSGRVKVTPAWDSDRDSECSEGQVFLTSVCPTERKNSRRCTFLVNCSRGSFPLSWASPHLSSEVALILSPGQIWVCFVVFSAIKLLLIIFFLVGDPLWYQWGNSWLAWKQTIEHLWSISLFFLFPPVPCPCASAELCHLQAL